MLVYAILIQILKPLLRDGKGFESHLNEEDGKQANDMLSPRKQKSLYSSSPRKNNVNETSSVNTLIQH